MMKKSMIDELVCLDTEYLEARVRESVCVRVGKPCRRERERDRHLNFGAG